MENTILFTKESKREINAQYYCDSLLTNFEVSMMSINFAPEEDSMYFVEIARKTFINLVTSNQMFGCFDNTITFILNIAKTVLSNAGDTMTEELSESLTKLQMTLYEYILQQQNEHNSNLDRLGR